MKEIQKLGELFRNGASFDIKTLAGAFEKESRINKRYKVNFITVISRKSPKKLFNEWKHPDFSFNVKHYDNFDSISLHRIITRSNIKNGKREVNGSFCLYRFKRSNIYTCFTSDSPDFFNNGLIKFLDSYKPDISKIYLSSGEMRNLFEKLEEKISCEIFVKKAVLYSHKEEGQILFEEKPFQELFNKAENEERYVDKIEYYIIKEKKRVYHGFISRSGISYYHSGNIHYFFNSFLPLIANRGKLKSKMFEGRERRFGTVKIRPINMVYPKVVFKTKNDNIRLIRALKNINRGAISVYHTNPYVHLSFLDFVDGSNFDIFGTEPDRISIIPNFKCSVHSLMRVCEQISKDFNEGRIESLEEPEFSLSDFIGE